MSSQVSPYNTTLPGAPEAHVTQEQILLHRIAQGDSGAFWTLWQQYASTHLASHSLRWMGGNRADADDALSSASVRAMQYLPLHAHKITHLKSWLTRLLYNHCMTLQKARRRRVHYEQSTENLEHVEPDSLHVPQMSAAEAVLLAERNMYIRQSIHTLPPRLREPVLLYFYGEMSQQDIARRLNLSHANVRKRLQHARALLRSRLTLYLQGDTGAAGSTAWTLPAYPAGLSRRKTCDRE